MLSVGIGIGLQHLRGSGAAGSGPLEGGIVLIDSDGNYLLDSTGAVLYAATEVFTAGDAFFSTADGVIFGVPA